MFRDSGAKRVRLIAEHVEFYDELGQYLANRHVAEALVKAILVDLRHYCDVREMDFAKIDTTAYESYVDELAADRDQG